MILPSWRKFNRVAIDVETRDPDIDNLGPGFRRDGYIAGISFACEGGPAEYLPIAHEGGGNLDREWVLSYLRCQASSYDGDIVGANLPYDLGYLQAVGIDLPLAKFRDIQIAEPLIDENRFSCSLDNIAAAHGLPGKNETGLKAAVGALGFKNPTERQVKANIWCLHADQVAKYAIRDVTLPLEIYERQRAALAADDLLDIWELECRVLPALLRMSDRGVRVDEAALDRFGRKVQSGFDVACEELRKEGLNLSRENVNKSAELIPWLQSRGVQLGTTNTGNPSIGGGVLDASDDPAVKMLAEARRLDKMRSSFVEKLPQYIINGRVHPEFKQLIGASRSGASQAGVRFGRLSCKNPNLQQAPTRNNIGKGYRKIFIPEEGELWASCDYSQQEPRWTAQLAALHKVRKGAEILQAYIDDPLLDNHDFMAQLTSLERSAAKAVFLGLCYGQGGGQLCEQLGLPVEYHFRRGPGQHVEAFASETKMIEAAAGRDLTYIGDADTQTSGIIYWRKAGKEGQRIIDQFNQRAPHVMALRNRLRNKIDKHLYVETIGGRRLHFHRSTNKLSGHPEIYGEYRALNRVIQGSAADQAKMALVLLEEAGLPVNLQVHDEFCLSFSDEKQAREAAGIMRNAHRDLKHGAHVKIDFRVDIETGGNWASISSIK